MLRASSDDGDYLDRLAQTLRDLMPTPDDDERTRTKKRGKALKFAQRLSAYETGFAAAALALMIPQSEIQDEAPELRQFIAEFADPTLEQGGWTLADTLMRRVDPPDLSPETIVDLAGMAAVCSRRAQAREALGELIGAYRRGELTPAAAAELEASALEAGDDLSTWPAGSTDSSARHSRG